MAIARRPLSELLAAVFLLYSELYANNIKSTFLLFYLQAGDGGLSASTPVFLNEIMHHPCTII